MAEPRMETFNKKLGINIMLARRELKISQQALCDYVGFKRTTLYKIEEGKGHLKVMELIKIAEKLETSIEKLIPKQC
jgi:DNA-binding XRE family transcriptional regulator